MIEIPEAVTLARQVNASLAGKGIQQVTAAASPHKFAWYYGDPADYPVRLTGEVLRTARAVGGTLELKTDHTTLTFSDGVNLRYLEPGLPLPQKHQTAIWHPPFRCTAGWCAGRIRSCTIIPITWQLRARSRR